MVLINPIDYGFFPFFYENEEIHRLSISSLPVFMIILVGFLFFPFIYYLAYKNRRKEKFFDWTMFSIGIFLIVFEIMKQITYAKMFGYLIGGVNEGKYWWNILPLQLCSMHIYLCPLIPFLKGKHKQNVAMFIGLYAFIGGITVLLGGLGFVLGGFQLENGQWFGDWFLVIHTLVWHIILIDLGALVFGYYHLDCLKLRDLFKIIRVPWIICISLMIFSQALNIILPYILNYDPWVMSLNLWNFSWITGFNLPILKEFCRTSPAWIGGVIGTILYGVALYISAVILLLVIIGGKHIIAKFKGVNYYTKDYRV